MHCFWITIVLLFSNFFRIDSIQTRIHRPIRFIDERAFPPRHFRHIDPLANAAPLDWEHGLREATFQALFKEHWGDGNLRKHIYAAPLLGKQDKATPFGDIAILARGQLYANYAGFIFVQDPYQNDCDECHNIEAADNARGRCIIHHCQIWQPKNNEKLIALWAIKRIRHRSRADGPQYEVEFTIAPIGPRYRDQGYLTKEGTFNYNLPAHVFILKTADSRQHFENDQNNNHPQNGFFIAQTPDGRKYVLHSFYGLLTPETPKYYGLPPKYPALTSTTSSTTQYSEEDDEKKLYETLLDVLHRKTSPDSTSFTPSSQTSTTLSDKTLVQFPNGQMVPITELETPFVTRTTPGYVAVRFPENSGIPATPGMHRTSPLTKATEGTTTSKVTPTKGTHSSSKVTPQSYGIMMPQTTSATHRTTGATMATQQLTTRHRTTVLEPHTALNEVRQTPSVEYTKSRPIYTTRATETSKQGSQLVGTSASITKQPVKMTFHFFAAEEAKQTTPTQHSSTVQREKYTEYDTSFSNTLVPTSESPVTETKAPTVFRDTTKYPTSTSTKISRPASIVRVTKPMEPTTISDDSLSTVPTTSKTFGRPTTIVQEPSGSFNDPIIVLDESTVVPTLQQDTTKYPTTQFQQVFTITPAPKTTYMENAAVPEGTTTYISTTALAKITSSEQGTTTNIGTKGPSSRESTLQPVVYTKVPTLEPEKGVIETTLGLTKIMGMLQNKTTEMVYYAAEETEASSQDSGQNPELTTSVQGIQVSSASTEPTNTILETKTTSPTAPKRIVTTIKADGGVFVKTTPITADEELFGKTKSSYKKYKVTRPSKIGTTSALGDFLSDTGSIPDHKIPLFKKTVKDYSEDDIFGGTKGTTVKTSNTINASKRYTKSDLEQALFDTNNRKSKDLIRRKSSPTEPPPNVVYSDFFEASTIPMTTVMHATTTPISIIPLVTKETVIISKGNIPRVRQSFSVANKKLARLVTTESVPTATTTKMTTTTTVLNDKIPTHPAKPVTSQSYLTSISYEVNKRKIMSDGENSQEKNGTTQGMFDIQGAQPATAPSHLAVLTVHDDSAFRLVGNAKGVEYLDRIDTTGASTHASTSAKTTRKTKYTRRRSYTPKAKRLTRKKMIISKEI